MKVAITLCVCLLLGTGVMAQAASADDYEKALQDEAADTAIQGQKSRDTEPEPPAPPMAEADVEALAETISGSLKKALANKHDEAAIRQEMGSVLSGALGQGMKLDEIRDAVQSAMSGVQAESGAEAPALEAAGKVVEDVIEANRQLIEGSGEQKSLDGQNVPAGSPVINMEKVQGEQRHVVKDGESLSLIARQYYKDGLKYWKIYQANQELLSNPDIILEGQELKIPE